MNNLKKIGLTALAGSLVAVGAQAGEMAVTGSLGVTYSTQNGNVQSVNSTNALQGANPDHGTGLGTDKDFQVSGSGELDNGFTFSGYTLLKDTMTLSSSALTMTMGSMGSLTMGTGYGGNSTKYDVQTPTAYEEVDDGGALSLSANYVGSWMDGNSLVYGSPSFDLMAGMSATVHVEYAVEASDAATVDGGVSSDTTYDGGKSLGVTLAGNGLTIGVYGAERERTNTGETANFTNDVFAGVYYINYAMGPVSVGYQGYYLNNGTAAKLGTAAGADYSGDAVGIAFNVNDQVSIGYQKVSEDKEARAGTVGVTRDIKSLSAAYSTGGMTMSIQQTDTDNYSMLDAGNELDTETVQVTLSFAF